MWALFAQLRIPEIPENHYAFAEIYQAAIRHRVNPEEMLRTAICESSLSMKAIGRAGEIGALQFMTSTFLKYAALDGIENPDIHSADQQAEVAAYMFSIEESRQWTVWRNLKKNNNLSGPFDPRKCYK